MNINGVTSASRANPYSTNNRAKASPSFGEMLAETAKRPMKTGNAYETYVHTGPLVEGTSIPESREGVFVQNTQYGDGMLTVSMLADSVANVPKEPEEILERLSEPARDTLEDIKADKEVSQEEWKDLLEELRDMGAISDTEFTYSRSDFRFIPIGYRDENGELVMYDGIAERFGMLDKLRTASGGGIGMLTDTADTWAGDPLAYLDAWITDLAEWREDLSKQRGETGAPKYDNFSPIDNQIEACTKVGEIVNGLLEQFE